MDINREALWEKVGYKPHPLQLEFHDSDARFKVPVCGRRFGKSLMAAMEVLPELFRPGTQGWIVGPTYDLGQREFEYLWDAIVIKLGLGPHLKAKANNPKTGSMYIEMPWGSRVDVKSADHPDSLVGKGLDWMIMSEAAKQRKQVWDKYLRPSLADKRGWAIFPSTPEGQNWYHELYQRGQDPKSPEYASWNFPSWENPYVYPGGFEDPEVQEQMRTPDDPWFWQEIGASFTSIVGRIYPEFQETPRSEGGHIIDGYEYNPDWSSYTAHDFGFTNPFVCLDVQIDPSDNIYIWREYYVPKKPVHEHASILAARKLNEGVDIRCGFGDSADPGAVETLSELFVPIYADPKAKDWTRGVQEIKRFLWGEDGKAHLFVDRSCVHTIWEFMNYMVRATNDSNNNKEDPRKYADHAMDAVRYLVMHLYVLGGGRYSLEDVMEVPKSLPPSINGEYARSGTGIFTRNDESVFTMEESPRW